MSFETPPPPPPPPPIGPPPGYQPYGGAMPVAHKKATWSMVCGIVGLLCFPIVFSVVAIVLGQQAKAEIDRSPGAYSNRTMATAGFVLGVVGLAFGVLFIAYRVSQR